MPKVDNKNNVHVYSDKLGKSCFEYSLLQPLPDGVTGYGPTTNINTAEIPLSLIQQVEIQRMSQHYAHINSKTSRVLLVSIPTRDVLTLWNTL